MRVLWQGLVMSALFPHHALATYALRPVASIAMSLAALSRSNPLEHDLSDDMYGELERGVTYPDSKHITTRLSLRVIGKFMCQRYPATDQYNPSPSSAPKFTHS